MQIQLDTFTKIAGSAVLGLCSLILVSCTQTTTNTTTQEPQWVDRTIYFATGDATGNNNSLQINNIQTAINNLSAATSFGVGYFDFQTADISTFNTSLSGTNNAATLNNFILVLPDNEFANYITSAPVNNNAPDPNAIAIINDSNKRYFFIVIKASCANLNCGTATNPFGMAAFQALIYRQMGLLMGMNVNCASPANIMCPTPNNYNGQWNDQFSTNSILQFSAGLDNVLNTIQTTPGFYPN